MRTTTYDLRRRIYSAFSTWESTRARAPGRRLTKRSGRIVSIMKQPISFVAVLSPLTRYDNGNPFRAAKLRVSNSVTKTDEILKSAAQRGVAHTMLRCDGRNAIALRTFPVLRCGECRSQSFHDELS